MSVNTLLKPETYDPNHLDGVLALQHLISQRVTISVYPRQIVTVQAADLEPLSFVHGVPDQSSLTSVVSVQHKRMRRAMFEKEGISIPKGATFSIGRGIAQSMSYAKRIGFPVVIKPSKGDFGPNAISDVNSVKEARKAVSEMKIPVHARDNVYRSGYTPMELGIPGIENGKEIVARSYRYLVEKQHQGDLLNFLVHDDTVLAVTKFNGSPLDGTVTSTEDVSSSVHSYLKQVAIKAGNAIPHLAVASIFMLARSSKLRLRKPQYVVVDLTERPFLSYIAKRSPREALRVSGQIVNPYLAASGYQTFPVLGNTRVEFRLGALPSARTAATKLQALSDDFSLNIEISEVDDLAGSVKGALDGGSFQIASLADALTNDLIPDVPAMLVELK